MNRFCRAELSSGDDSRVCVWVCFYSGLSLDMFIVYSREVLDFWTSGLAGWLADRTRGTAANLRWFSGKSCRCEGEEALDIAWYINSVDGMHMDTIIV